MKKDQALLLLTLLALSTPTAWGQGAMTRTGGAVSLPSTCTPSRANAAADTIIVNNVYYICTATNTWTSVRGLEADNTWTNNMRFAGPDPWADITAFGARALGGAPTGRVTCTNGSNHITALSNLSWGQNYGFMVNDGITIWGCGPSVMVTAATGISVMPSGTWGLAGTESPLTVATGSTSYSYSVITRDIYGGLSAASTPVTMSSGLASLGKQTATIRTLSKTNDKITVVTAAPSPLVVGDLIELEPTTNQEMGGWYNVAQVDSSTQFELFTTETDTRAQGSMIGDSTGSSGGGTVVFYRSNYLRWTPVKGAWEYYVCAKRTGLGDTNYHLIGVTKPTGISNGYVDAAFEDYGSPYMDLQNYPPYVQTVAEAAFNNKATNIAKHITSNAVCTASSPLNDPLSTWILSSPDNGTTLVLNGAAMQTIVSPGTGVIMDGGVAIRRALATAAYVYPNFLGSGIYIPPSISAFTINSYVAVPNNVTIWQSGKLTLNETMSLGVGVNWYGDWSSQGNPQFGLSSGASINSVYANPTLYLKGTGSNLRMLNVSSSAANGSVGVFDDSGTSTYDLDNFSTGGASTDYLGMTYVTRPSGSIQMHFFNKTSFLSGPDQVNDKSWTPSFWVNPPQDFANGSVEITMKNTSWNRRGFAAGGGGVSSAGITGTSGDGLGLLTSDFSYQQGGILPYFVLINAVAPYQQLTINDSSQDTTGQPLEAAFIVNPQSGILGPRISVHNPAGNGNPLFGGLRPSFADIDMANFANAKSIPNRDFLYKTSGNMYAVTSPYQLSAPGVGSIYAIGLPMHGSGGYSWWFDLQAPTDVTATAAGGGSIPAGTYVYAVSATGADGAETIVSMPSSSVTTGGGNRTVNLTWTGAVGSYTYNVFRCKTTATCLTTDGIINQGGGSAWKKVVAHTSGTSYSDTSAAPQSTTLAQATGTGSTIMNGTGLYSSLFQAPPITVSQLPVAAVGNAGQVRRVTDSTAITTEGQTCVGGSTHAALVFSNGTVWKCF